MDLIERHRRFWNREPVDRPLFGVSRQGAFFLQPFLDLGVGDGPLPPEAVPDPEAFIEPYYEKTIAGDPLDGDVFWVAKPPRAIPWMEAIIGCSIYIFSSSKAMTVPEPSELRELDGIDLSLNPWLHLMTAFTVTLANQFGDRFPVGQTLMRGPSDMMSALLGQRFYTELYDNPKGMKKLACQCTDVWIKVLQAQFEHIPRYQGGYVSGTMGLWAPGPVAVYQEDAAGFVSPTMYLKFFFDCDAAIAAAFEYSLLHLHSASQQILGPVLEIPNLDAVNVVVDPIGPGLGELIPKLQRVQQAGKALHLQGDMSEQDIELAKRALSPDGLCIWIVREK